MNYRLFVFLSALLFRYRAYIKSKKDKFNSRHQPIVPLARLHKEATYSASHNQNSASKGQSESDFEGGSAKSVELSHDLESLTKVEPELVYLCQRGYNHCSGKLTSKSKT